MIKKCVYTVMSLVLAVSFVFGSMYLINELLKFQERRLLTENGKAEVESPVMPLKELLADKEKAHNLRENAEYDEKYELTADDIQSVLICWYEGVEVVHDPVEGQISMNEAITAGYNWLREMNINVPEKKGVALNYVSALLLAVTLSKENLEKLAPYYSFWKINLYTEESDITLYVNAVTSTVWKADIIHHYKEKDKETFNKNRYDDLTKFIELSGLSASEITVSDYSDDSLTVSIKNTELYANLFYGEAYSELTDKVNSEQYSAVVSGSTSVEISYSLQI